MATKSERVESPLTPTVSEKGLKCGLCCGEYEKPCLLPCLHAFCNQCILRYEQQDFFTEEGSCRKLFLCPDEHCQAKVATSDEERPTNLRLVRELIVERKTLNICGPEAEPLCDVCSRDATAKRFCVLCCKAVCDNCIKCPHKQDCLKEEHDLLTISMANSDRVKRAFRSSQTSNPLPCHQHPKEVVKIYCTRCSTPICMDCFLDQHNGHKVEKIENAAAKIKKKLQDGVADLRDPSEKLQKAIEMGKEMKQKVVSQETIVANMISTTFDELLKIVEDRKMRLLSECKEIGQAKRMRIDIQIEKLQKLQYQIDFSSDVALSSADSHTRDELFSESQVIMDRLESLLSTFAEHCLSPCTGAGIAHNIETASLIKEAQKLGAVVEGCHPPNCVLEMNPPGRVIICALNAEKTLRLVARDYEDNPVKWGGEPVVAVINGEKADSTTPVTCLDRNDGTYQIRLQMAVAGSFKLSVTVRDQHVQGSPFDLVVQH